MLRALAILAVAASASLPATARAHGVVQQIEDRGDQCAIRIRYEGGKPLAGTTYRIVSPSSPDRTWGEGRTDGQGWVELAPDAPGVWQVRIVDATGHGRVVNLQVPADRVRVPAPASLGAGATAAAEPPERKPTPEAPAAAPPHPLARAVVAAAALLLGFLALRAAYRRRAARR